MKGFLRRLRGIIGTGFTWAVGWGAAFTGLRALFGFPYDNLLEAALNGSILGLAAGGSFAVILSIAERRRTLDQLSLRRVAAWGGVGGMALLLLLTPVVFASGLPLVELLTLYLTLLALNASLGAGFATGSVALAQRDDMKMLEGKDLDELRVEGG